MGSRTTPLGTAGRRGRKRRTRCATGETICRRGSTWTRSSWWRRAPCCGPGPIGWRAAPEALCGRPRPARAVLPTGATAVPSGSQGRWWTAGEFESATRQVAGRLRGAGLVPGDRVVWSAASSIPALVAHVAALRAGLVVVPANVAYSERELAHLVLDARPVAAIVDRAEQADWVRRASGGAVQVVHTDVDLPDADAGPLDEAGPDDPALICYTSGTTGAPKGAVLRHRNLLAAAESVRVAWRWEPDDRLVHALPVFHAHGLCVGVYGTLLAGASAVLLPGFDPDAVAEPLAEHGVVVLRRPHHVPPAAPIRAGSGAGPDSACASPAPPRSRPELHAAVERGHRLAGARALRHDRDTHERLQSLCRRPPGRDRRVPAPRRGGQRWPTGDEILVRGPNIFGGYWERPAATAESFTRLRTAGHPGSGPGTSGSTTTDTWSCGVDRRN